jgi:hypothetical protein
MKRIRRNLWVLEGGHNPFRTTPEGSKTQRDSEAVQLDVARMRALYGARPIRLRGNAVSPWWWRCEGQAQWSERVRSAG